ncbi:MAG: PAS domain S-box protein [Parasphingorhabdus sp.]
MDEQARLQELYNLAILDTRPERLFDGLVEITAGTFNVPTVLISLVDKDRQWFKAGTGFDARESVRENSFCNYAIGQNEIFEVPDATLDHRFCNNPIVVGDPKIRYYAAAPLVVGGGFAVGTLCLIDYKPREPLGQKEREMLLRLGQQVVELLEARKLREIGRISKLVNDTLNDAIVLSDAAGTITYCNPAAEHIFGWSAVEMTGQPLSLLLPEPFHPMLDLEQAHAASREETALVDQPVEACARRQCGEEFPVELSLARWKSPDGDQKSGFVAVIRDISRRKRLEVERQRSETFLNAVVENLPSMLFVKNAETRAYEMFNRAAEEMTGRL